VATDFTYVNSIADQDQLTTSMPFDNGLHCLLDSVKWIHILIFFLKNDEWFCLDLKNDKSI
jgi:hypothetical protein